MAKVATDTSIGPNTSGAGNGIFHTGVQAVQELLNHAFRRNTTTYFSLETDPAEFYSPFIRSLDYSQVYFPIGATPIDRFQGEIWIDPDVQEIRVDASARCLAGNEVEVEFTIGGDAVTLPLGDGSLGDFDQADSLFTSATGTGWQPFTITLTHTVGGAALNELVRLRCESRFIVGANIPSPLNE